MKFSVRNLSLRQISVLGVALGILLPALIFGSLIARSRYDREIELRVQAPMTQYTEMLSRAMAVPIWNVDRQVGKQFVEGVMRNPEVARVVVTDEAGAVFVSQQKLEYAPNQLRRMMRPVVLDKRIIGRVEVAVTTEYVAKDLLEDLLKLVAAITAQVILSFGMVWYVFDRRVVRPVQRLQTETNRLASGQLSEPLVWQRSDEIGDLASGLNVMRLNLGRLISEREQQNKILKQELTERMRAEAALRETEDKFIAIFQASPVAMTVMKCHPVYRMIDVNDAWVRQFGWSHDAILGQISMQEYLWCQPEDMQHVMKVLERDGEIHAFEAWCRSGLGHHNLLCEISGKLVHIADEAFVILVQEDITEKRKNEQEVHRMNQTLERRVSERTRELQEKNAELNVVLNNLKRAQQELVRTEKMAALGSLVAGVAHELNTPIGTSVTVASTLHQQTEDLAAQFEQGLRKSSLQDFLSNARLGTDLLLRNLNKASELVSSFKQVAVDRTSANRRRFALHEMMDELILTLGPMIRKSRHGVQSDIAEGLVLDSYPGALGQVMTNLINNAFIHAFDEEHEGVVHIVARAAEDNKISIVVSDNGKGILPAHISRIFDPFFTTRLGQGGSGLGLNIVYNLVHEVLEGSISVDSKPGQGTRFELLLPAVVRAAAEAQQTSVLAQAAVPETQAGYQP